MDGTMKQATDAEAREQFRYHVVRAWEAIRLTNIPKDAGVYGLARDLHLCMCLDDRFKPMASRIAEAERRIAADDRPKADDPSSLHKRLSAGLFDI